MVWNDGLIITAKACSRYAYNAGRFKPPKNVQLVLYVFAIIYQCKQRLTLTVVLYYVDAQNVHDEVFSQYIVMPTLRAHAVCILFACILRGVCDLVNMHTSCNIDHWFYNVDVHTV